MVSEFTQNFFRSKTNRFLNSLSHPIQLMNHLTAGDEFKYVASVFFKGLDAYYEWNDKEEYSQSSSLAKHLRDGYLGVGAGRRYLIELIETN